MGIKKHREPFVQNLVDRLSRLEIQRPDHHFPSLPWKFLLPRALGSDDSLGQKVPFLSVKVHIRKRNYNLGQVGNHSRHAFAIKLPVTVFERRLSTLDTSGAKGLIQHQQTSLRSASDSGPMLQWVVHIPGRAATIRSRLALDQCPWRQHNTGK